jgi:hypothetical protein
VRKEFDQHRDEVHVNLGNFFIDKTSDADPDPNFYVDADPAPDVMRILFQVSYRYVLENPIFFYF